MSDAVPIRDSDVVSASPGRQLAVAREGCGLSVTDVARQLKLSPRQIEALEADDYARMPGAVFVRGFIRNYARLLKLDAAALLAQVDTLPSTAHRVREPSPSIDIPFRSGREIKWRRYAMAALLLLALAVIYEFLRGDAPEVTVKSRPVALPQPHVVAPPGAHAAGSAQASAPGASGEAPARIDAAPPPAEKNAPARAVTAGRIVKPDQMPGEHLVKLKFEREAWVEIRDRSGRKIFSQLNPAGTERAVSGQPPLTLVVGNAAGVRVIHNERAIDLAPHIQVDVARLTLE